MISYQSQFQPGKKIIQKTKPGTAYGKYKLEKGLLSIAGPQIQIIHIKPFYFHTLIYPKGKAYQHKQHNQICFPS